MPPKYVIVMHAEDGAAGFEMGFDDELDALISAWRVFMQECFTTERRPLAVSLGRRRRGGEVDWINGWRSIREAGAGAVRPPPDGRPSPAKPGSRRAS